MAITFTEAAVSRGRQVLQDKGAEWVRLGIRGGGCSGLSYFMEFVEAPQEKDKEIAVDGLRVCVDRKSYLYLNGTEVDFEESLVRNGFVFHNPMAKRSCSCGESFSL
jgi:iron-sulfur cluster assembly protein